MCGASCSATCVLLAPPPPKRGRSARYCAPGGGRHESLKCRQPVGWVEPLRNPSPLGLSPLAPIGIVGHWQGAPARSEGCGAFRSGSIRDGFLARSDKRPIWRSTHPTASVSLFDPKTRFFVPTHHLPLASCRDADKAGRPAADADTLALVRPRLDGVEHEATLAWIRAMIPLSLGW